MLPRFRRRQFLAASGVLGLMIHSHARGRSDVGDLTINLASFGAVGDGRTDDTRAFREAVSTLAERGGGTLQVPEGVYVLTPDLPAPNYLSAADPQFGPLYFAVEMRSNVKIVGRRATIKVRDGVSTDAQPRNFALFYSERPLRDLKFAGIRFDLNGGNNRISPRRADTALPLERRYGRQHHAAIIFEGVEGKADDVLIERCSFNNCAGVNCIVSGRVAPISGLGKRWQIVDCQFHDNGLDTYDHSSIYLFSDHSLINGCRFENSQSYAPSEQDVTGIAAAVETHGSHTTVSNNVIIGGNRGLFVSENLSWGHHGGPAGYPVSNVVVRDNLISGTKFCGIDLFFGGVDGVPPPRAIFVLNNVIEMSPADESIAAEHFPAAINMIGTGSALAPVEDLLIAGNRASRGLSPSGRSAHFMSMAVLAPGFKSLRLQSNQATGFTRGLYVYTLDGASCDEILLTQNRWGDPHGGRLPDVGEAGKAAVFILAQGGQIGRFHFDDSILDSRDALDWQRGISLVRQGGTPETGIARFEIGDSARFDPRFRPGARISGLGSAVIGELVGP